MEIEIKNIQLLGLYNYAEILFNLLGLNSPRCIIGKVYPKILLFSANGIKYWCQDEIRLGLKTRESQVPFVYSCNPACCKADSKRGWSLRISVH
jgi:hypothetical protein